MIKKLLIIVTFYIFVVQGIALAEPYVSTKFPSNELLEKLIYDRINKRCRIIGYHEVSKDNYQVYYQRGNNVHTFPLVKLNNNIWIAWGEILQKYYK